MCIEGEERPRDTGSAGPYNSLRIDTTCCLDPSSPEMDYWSVGVVILEILAGTELVIAANSAKKMHELL